MTRQRIDYFVRSLDTSRLITTTGPLLITGPTEPIQPTAWLATEDSYNHYAQAYECFFCHKLFQSLPALNQHLASPRHAYATETGRDGEKLYKCPNPSCARHFVTLSGLVQHAEHGGCGVLQFRTVQNTLDGFMGQMRTLTY